MADSPSNFVYHSDTDTISWDAVQDAEEYKILSCPNLPAQTLVEIYDGTDTSCAFNYPPGSYEVTGGSKMKDGWRPHGNIEIIMVTP